MAHGAQVLFVECDSPPELTLQRLAQRWRQRTREGEQKLAASQASDGRPDLYAKQRDRWENFDAREEAEVQHVLLPTTQAVVRQVEHILDLLDLPRLACPLI